MTDPRRRAVVQAAMSQVGHPDVPAYWASCGLSPDTHEDWCGVFCLAMLHAADLAPDVEWRVGLGFLYRLAQTKDPQPGDIGYYDKPYQHHDVVVSLTDGVLKTVDGNAPGVRVSERPVPEGAVFYSIDKFLKVATPPVATALTAAPDPGSPGGETKLRDTTTATTGDALLHGVDVSHHQATSAVNWVALARTHRFVVARATYGTTADEAFGEHVHRAREVGLKTGAYHFFRPSQGVDEQLEAFSAAVRRAGMGAGWLVPAIDLETDPGHPVTTDIYAPARELAEKFRSEFGACMVYVAVGFWAEIGQPEWVREHLLWTAHWGVAHPTTPFNMPWQIWQNKVGVVQGVAPGPLDQDVAESLPLLREHDPAAPLLLAVDWHQFEADRDAEVDEKTT